VSFTITHLVLLSVGSDQMDGSEILNISLCSRLLDTSALAFSKTYVIIKPSQGLLDCDAV